MEEQLLETWRIHHRIGLSLLGAIPDEALTASLTPRGRSVAQLFAHQHNVRLMWLQSAAPDLRESLEKLESKPPATKGALETALTASGSAVEALLRRSLAAGGTVKGFAPHAVAFLGYLISHESHHRGQIEWALKHAGHPLDDRVSYGLWEWGTR